MKVGPAGKATPKSVAFPGDGLSLGPGGQPFKRSQMDDWSPDSRAALIRGRPAGTVACPTDPEQRFSVTTTTLSFDCVCAAFPLRSLLSNHRTSRGRPHKSGSTCLEDREKFGRAC